MADLLLELYSEEIPARFQPRAEDDLARLLKAALEENHLAFKGLQTYSTPRRLAARVTGLPKAQPDTREEKRGPRVDAPEKAVQGFLSSVGLERSEVEERETEKGKFLFAVIHRKGRKTGEVLAEILPGLIRKFPWPKSMRWGRGRLRWVRPLHSILCVLDEKVVPFAADGILSRDYTFGHRFLAPGRITAKTFLEYRRKLEKAFVVLEADRRRDLILKAANKLAAANRLELVEDDQLLTEVAGLVEWPNLVLGTFDADYLKLPEEVLIAVMRHHQKFFSLRKGSKLANHFINVADTLPDDGGKAIAAGNARVLSARLADARFFWEEDRKTLLEEMAKGLKGVIFHEKIGTLWDKTLFNAEMAEVLSGHVEGSRHHVEAARLAKADLVSQMVGEFPELQGIMGGYYAFEEGLPSEAATAIREHYAPEGPADFCPNFPESVVVALADKISTLAAFWIIGEKPTGSKDPFALRRAALGVIRLIVENGLRLPLADAFSAAYAHATSVLGLPGDDKEAVIEDLLSFLAERLKVQTREKGVRHDLIDAVFSAAPEDDLVRLLARVEALQKFLATKDGKNLLAGYKRAVNIVRIEEKKDGRPHTGKVDRKLLKEKEEKALFDELESARERVAKALEREDFGRAMAAVAALRKPVDRFFDHVTVNIEDAKLRDNRLRLLAGIRETLMPVADFSKIEGEAAKG